MRIKFPRISSAQASGRCVIALKDGGSHPHFPRQTGRIFAIDRCPKELIPPRTRILHFARPITIQTTLRSALANRFQHFLGPRYHCSTSRIEPRHRRRRVHRPIPSRPPPLFSYSVGHIPIAEHAWNLPTKYSPRCSATIRPSSFSAKSCTWNIIGRDHCRVRMRPPRRTINIPSLGETLKKIPIDPESPIRSQARSLVHQNIVRLLDDQLDIASSTALGRVCLPRCLRRWSRRVPLKCQDSLEGYFRCCDSGG